ncbi:MAG TPA: amidohydrolase family protein [Chitinophagaceae bacterium]
MVSPFGQGSKIKTEEAYMLKFAAAGIFDGHRLRSRHEALIVNESGAIMDIIPGDEAGEGIRQFDGILCPGFVNAHCHLELSHLKGAVPEKTGLVKFLATVTGHRNDYREEDILSAIGEAAREMYDNGIAAVGDIANGTRTLQQKQQRLLYYHTFVEAMGFTEEKAGERFRYSLQVLDQFRQLNGAAATLAPHAPYSVSASLFRLIGDQPGNRLISIHNQESAAEDELFRSKTGALLDLYKALEIDCSSFRPSGKSSLQTWLPHFSAGRQILLVHNTFTSEDDIKFAAQCPHEIYWCLCPNANLYIEDRLPAIGLLQKNNCNIILGTDSLASNHQLSILEELKTIRRHFPRIPLREMLGWATSQGARALNIQGTHGSFDTGKKPGVLLIEKLREGQLSAESRVKRLI